MPKPLVLMALISLISITGAAWAEGVGGVYQGPDPKSTETFTEDRNTLDTIPDVPKATMTDKTLVETIQKSIISDKNLSPLAHRIKIISAKGRVTLQGLVMNSEESKAIETKAEYIAGSGHVMNKLHVRSP